MFSSQNTYGISNSNQRRNKYQFSFDMQVEYTASLTKRKDSSSLFYLLHLLLAIIMAKIDLQQLWMVKTNWDELIPQTIGEIWERLARELKHLNIELNFLLSAVH